AVSALAVIAACASAPPPEEAPPPAPPPPAPPPPEPVASAPAAPSASASAAPAAAPPEDASGGACPANMVLIHGDYCTRVEHKCKKEWYAAANKKRVCEDFEEKATCVGERIKKRYCIDKYEWPNVAGERPEVMNRFHQAQVKCAAVGKRMCSETEWN